MALMLAVGVIEAQDTAIVGSEHVGQQKARLELTNGLTFCVDPDFFAKDADAACTPKTGPVIRYLVKVNPSVHQKSVLR